MNEVKVWCERCCGSYVAGCPDCDGKGYIYTLMEKGIGSEVTVATTYDITDAQADAAVLTRVCGMYKADLPNHIPEIENAIIKRLHAFYCGKEGEK